MDVKDVSTDDVRIELTIKRDADPKLVMAYLWKHTPLQTNFPVNLTCLVPTENPEVGRPERLDLHQMLWHFLHFRLDVVTARLEHELGALQEAHSHPGRLREGLRRARRDPADRPQVGRQGGRGREDHRAVRPRRRADRRDPRAEDLPARAARDPRHHQRARREAQARAKQIGGLLTSEQDRWALVRDEIAAIQKTYADPKTDPRRTDALHRRQARSSTPPTTSSSRKTTS